MLSTTGCTHLSGESEISQAAADSSFHAQGRFSARFSTNHGEEALAARFDWQHAPDADEIKLIAPLGATVARLAREGDTVTVEQVGRAPRAQQVTNWDELTTQTLGFPVPVESLSYWLRGVASPGAAAVTRDAAGRIDSLRQHGWEVQYSYAESRQPDRLDIRYGETVGLRLKIDTITLPEASR
ncbi:MAG: lipoprotein insertase outer membrane protein LolB [Burkholderiales bacterium]|nr:lipoprotein insertase outer membrane protein LolB [Burkholderiales bacterium]